MKHIKKLFAVSFVCAGVLSLGACDLARAWAGVDDCHVNANFEFQCGDLDPTLTQP